jgi:hypothetical protein
VGSNPVRHVHANGSLAYSHILRIRASLPHGTHEYVSLVPNLLLERIHNHPVRFSFSHGTHEYVSLVPFLILDPIRNYPVQLSGVCGTLNSYSFSFWQPLLGLIPYGSHEQGAPPTTIKYLGDSDSLDSNKNINNYKATVPLMKICN